MVSAGFQALVDLDMKLLIVRTECERKARMIKPKRNWQLTLVDALIGLAVLMVLSGLVVPKFIPPGGKAVPSVAGIPAATQPSPR
jgi:hypothetical protein